MTPEDVKAVGPDEELVPGKFYWLDNDPDGDGVSSKDETTVYAGLNSSPLAKDLKRDSNGQVTSVGAQQEALNKEKIAFIQDKCGDTYASGDDLDALYESCRSKKDSAEKKYGDLKASYNVAGPDVKLGDFVVTQVRYKTDNSGRKLEGIGMLEKEGLPSDLSSMFALEGGRAPVVIDVKDGNTVIGAYTRSVQGIRLGTGENALRLDSDNNKAAIEYLSIDREGVLEAELTAEMEGLPVRNYFVLWLPKYRHSSVVLKPDDGNAGEVWKKVEIKQRNYIQLGLVLGDETVASRVWEKEGAVVRERGEGDRKWLVNFPVGAKGLFEPVVKRGGEDVRIANSDSPDYWLPASVETKEKDGKKTLSFFAPISGVEWLSGLHQGAVPPDGSYKDIEISEEGEMETVGNAKLQYKEGSFVFGDKQEIFQGFIKGWSLTPSLKPYYTLANIVVGWNPSFAYRIGTEDKGVLKDVGFTGSLSVGIIKSLYKKSADSKEAMPGEGSAFKQKISNFFRNFEMSSVEFDYLLRLVLAFNGFQINLETGAGLKLEKLRQEGEKKTYLVTSDSNGMFPLALDDPDNKYELKIKANAVDTWIAQTGSSERTGFKRRVKLDGFGRYRFSDSVPLVGGQDLSVEFLGNITSTGPYSKEKQTYVVAKRATLRLGEDSGKKYGGWQFSLDEFTVEFEESKVESESLLDMDMGGGGSDDGMGLSIPPPFVGAALVPEAVINVVKSDWKPARFTAYTTVAPPGGWEFGGPFEALLLVEKKRDTVNKTDYWATTITADMNLNVPMGGDDYYMVFKQLVLTMTKGHEWLALADAEFHLAGKIIAGTVMFKDGGFTMLVKGYKLDDVLSGADLMLNFAKGDDKKWTWTVGLGLVFSKESLAKLFGVDPSMIKDDLLANGILNKDGTFVLQLGNVPLPFLTSVFPSWMEMERIRNVMFSKKGPNNLEFMIEADFLFDKLIDKSRPRDQWTRFTLSVIVGSSGVQVAGRNLEIEIGDGGKVTVVEMAVAKGKEDWKGDLQVELQPRKEWVDALASVVKLPEKIRGIGQISSAGWLVGAKWDPPPVINLGGGGMELKLKELIFKKMSPWSFEVGTELKAGGNVLEGTIGYGDKGASFSLPGTVKLSLELPGGFKVDISNLRIALSNMAFGGDVDISVPEGNIVRSLVGKRFAATLSGSAAEMSFKTNANITTNLDMGPLGKAVLSIKSISLSSLGSFAGSGRMTLGGVTTDFVIGTQNSGLYFLADFGDKGVSLELAKVFMLKIKNTIGLESLGPVQYLRIDDLQTGLGNQISGVDLATRRFLYLLPSSAPPVGFAFFDNLDGNVHIVGFAVNVGLNFPAPKAEDILTVLKVVVGALSGGNVNWTDLGTMSAPAFGVHDVYMKFPKVPGYAWQDGGLKHTDNLFAAMFGSDRLAMVDRISLGPKQFVQAVSSYSALDVIKLIIPADKRKGGANVDLRGFKAGINYDLREDETIYEQKTVDILPGLYNFVQKVRYAEEKAGSVVPAELMQGDKSAKSKTDEIVMPSDLGGGKSRVKWEVADMKAELNSVKDLISFLTPEKGSDWRQHLQSVWDKLVKKSGKPAFDGNSADFAYSATLTARLEMNEYEGKYDISGLSLKNNALMAKFGTATLFADVNFQGASYAVRDDMPYSVLASSPVKNDALSSVKMDGRGRIIIYEHDFAGASSEIVEDQENLDELSVHNDMATSVRAFYPLDLRKVTKWRAIFRSGSDIITVVDAGGIQVSFPDGSKLLSMLPGSRLVRAVEDTRTAIGEMKPYPGLFNDPKGYLASVWSGRMLPLRSKAVEGEDDTELSEKPVEFRRDDGVILGLSPLKYAGDRPITGTNFDRNSGVLYGKLGKATLYEHANYQGKALELKSDIADLGATDFGNDIASSIKIEDGGKAALFSEVNYGTKWIYDYTSAVAKHSGRCMDVSGGGTGNGSNIQQWECHGGDNQSWKLIPLGGDYYRIQVKHSGRCMDVSGGGTGNGPNIQQWECHNGDNQKWKLVPLGGDYYRIQAKHSGRCMDVASRGTGNGPNIHQWDCHDGDNQKWKLKLNKVSYEATTFEKDSDLLKNNPVGNDMTRSAKVFFPMDMSGIDQWKVSQTMPSGATVTAGYRKKEDGTYESYVVTVLSGTENSIKTLYGPSGNAVLTPVTGSGLEYPLDNYRLYVKGEVVDIAEVLEANKYVRLITKTYTMPDGSTVNVNMDGGIAAKYRGIDISPADAGSAASVFTLTASDNSGLIFNITKAGGFDSAVISGSNPAVITPIYRDGSGAPVGIRKPVKTVPGGFFVDAHLNAGASSIVQININVSGAIKTDGNFYMKGNGNLLIANYEISEAAIELSSENGLYIRGKMDIFKAAKVDIEGYLRPDGEFSFTGKAQIMVSGTGIKGALAFNNGGLNINGGIYIANASVASGSFIVDAATGRVAWKSNVGIGFAGFNSTLWLQMKTPYGAGFNGRAYVDLDIPIYVWGAKSWKCKKIWGVKICWPKSWGDIKIGNIPLHYNQSVSGGISGSTIKFGLGRANLKVDIVKPSLNVSW